MATDEPGDENRNDPELRRRLVSHLAARRRLEATPEAVELIALRSERAPGSLGGFGGSVRELEGLLNQVEAVSRLIPDAFETPLLMISA